MKPFTATLIFALILVVAGGIVVRLWPDSGTGPDSNATPVVQADATATPETPSIKFSMASSITKWEWLEAAVEIFNAKSRTDPALQVDGTRVEVEVLREKDPLTGALRHWNSPTQVQATLDGVIQPTVLSPAATIWIDQLNDDWSSSIAAQGLNIGQGQVLTSGPTRSLLSTPVVIAMWESRARALDCFPVSGPGCTWERIRDLAVDPDGWTGLGHEDWGSFHFGYAYVGESDVGTQTAVMLCMAGLDKFEDLTLSEITSTNQCGQAIADVEEVLVHRGTSSPLILKEMLEGGPSFLDAVTTYEKNVIGFNRDNPNSVWGPLVAIYPQDGTVVADHTYAILDNAPWVTGEQVRAAELFREFLFTSEQQQLLLGFGLRPADTSLSLGSPIDALHGADSDANIVTFRKANLPVVKQVVDVWKARKKPANVVLVFDKSGSMRSQKIAAALGGAVGFVDQMDSNDWLAWLPFDSVLYTGTRGLKSAIGEDLIDDIRSTKASGGTSLYDAISSGFHILEERRSLQGDAVRYGIVVLSDGQDEGSDTTLQELLEDLTPTELDPIGIQVHIIGIGEDADTQVLTKIADTTNGGRHWEVKDTTTTEAVYRRISKYW